MKRPLGLVTLSYGGGLLLGEFFQPSLVWLFVCALALAGAALAAARLRFYLIWPLLVLTGWTNLVRQTAVISPRDLRVLQATNASLVTVRGTLVATPEMRVTTRNGRESVHSLAQL